MCRWDRAAVVDRRRGGKLQADTELYRWNGSAAQSSCVHVALGSWPGQFQPPALILPGNLSELPDCETEDGLYRIWRHSAYSTNTRQLPHLYNLVSNSPYFEAQSFPVLHRMVIEELQGFMTFTIRLVDERGNPISERADLAALDPDEQKKIKKDLKKLFSYGRLKMECPVPGTVPELNS